MAVAYFGNHLVEQGYVTRDQLEEAWAVQPAGRLLALAVSKGILLPAEIERLKELYGSSPDGLVDRAIKSGALSESQVGYLRRMLMNDWRGLGAALLRLGFLSQDALDQAVRVFRVTQSGYQPANIPLPDPFHGRADVAALLGLIQHTFAEVAQVDITLTGPSLVEGARLASERVMGIDLSGDFAGSIAMDVDQSLVAELVLWIAGGARVDLTDEVWRDACGEFLNILVGNAAAVLSSFGHELLFSPPRPFSGSGEAPAALHGLYVEGQTAHGIARMLLV